MGGDFSFRLYGNLDKTQADAWDINQGHQSERTGTYSNTLPAGREGVINKDINGVVRWDFAPLQSLELEAGYSRQGNLYAGDTQNTNTNQLVKDNYGKETNRLYRQNYSLTWNGGWITASPPATGCSTNTRVTPVHRKAWQVVLKGFSTRMRHKNISTPT